MLAFHTSCNGSIFLPHGSGRQPFRRDKRILYVAMKLPPFGPARQTSRGTRTLSPARRRRAYPPVVKGSVPPPLSVRLSNLHLEFDLLIGAPVGVLSASTRTAHFVNGTGCPFMLKMSSFPSNNRTRRYVPGTEHARWRNPTGSGCHTIASAASRRASPKRYRNPA